MAPNQISTTIVPLSEVPQESYEGRMSADILVVDDDRLVADTLALVFRHNGFRVRIAYDPRTALAMVRAEQPDIVVSDVDMPVMDGVAMALEIRRKCPQCPIVLISGHATIEALLAKHGDSFSLPLLTKPVPPTQMLAAVRGALHGARSAYRSVDTAGTSLAA